MALRHPPRPLPTLLRHPLLQCHRCLPHSLRMHTTTINRRCRLFLHTLLRLPLLRPRTRIQCPLSPRPQRPHQEGLRLRCPVYLLIFLLCYNREGKVSRLSLVHLRCLRIVCLLLQR